MRISDWSSDVCSSDLPCYDAEAGADLRAHPRVRTQSKLGQIVQGSDPLSDGPNDECTVGAGIHFQPRARKRESRALGIWRQWEPSAGTCDHIKSVIVDRARERSRAEDRLGILQDSDRTSTRLNSRH